MDFVTAREFRLHPGSVWEKLFKEKALIITLNGKPVGLLSDLPQGDVEGSLRLLWRLRAEQAVIEIRRQAKSRGLDRISPPQIERAIRGVRRQRAR